MSDGLKPCPSCGPGTAVEEFHPLPEKYPSFPAVICRECGMRGPRSTWNVRKPGPDRGTIDDLARFNALARKLVEARAEMERLRAAAIDVLERIDRVAEDERDWDPPTFAPSLMEKLRAAVAEHRAGGGEGQGAKDHEPQGPRATTGEG